MNWLKAEFRFDHRRATLVVPYQRLPELAYELGDLSESPDALEDFARQLIANARPDLEQACIYFIRFNHESNSWEFAITHPSLPRCLPGCYAPRIELIPEELTGKEPTNAADKEG